MVHGLGIATRLGHVLFPGTTFIPYLCWILILVPFRIIYFSVRDKRILGSHSPLFNIMLRNIILFIARLHSSIFHQSPIFFQ